MAVGRGELNKPTGHGNIYLTAEQEEWPKTGQLSQMAKKLSPARVKEMLSFIAAISCVVALLFDGINKISATSVITEIPTIPKNFRVEALKE